MLRQLRRQRGLTMKQLGREFGLSESTICQYEAGRRQADYTTLQGLADFFGCSVDYLLTGRTAAPEAASDEAVKFALFGGQVDDAVYEEVKAFARFAEQRYQQRMAGNDEDE